MLIRPQYFYAISCTKLFNSFLNYTTVFSTVPAKILFAPTLICSGILVVCCLQEAQCNALIEAYVDCLIDEKEIDLVAIYVATLPRSRQVDLYARLPKGLLICCFVSSKFLARDSVYAIARYMPSPVRLAVRLSGRLSGTRVDQSKTVEVRIKQPSPQSSPMTLVS